MRSRKPFDCERLIGVSASRKSNRQSARPASLATLAEHLGLSPAAISRVLNRVPAAKSIPQATQDRIFAAAKLFNYRPNVLARSLQRGHSMTIGVLMPEVSEGYATLVLAGIEQALLQAGYCYLLNSHHRREELVERSIRMFEERSTDGMIAIDTVLHHDTHLPTVTVSCPLQPGDAIRITLDHSRAAELAIDHLVELGHTRIAILKGQAFSSDTEPRAQAIHRAAARAGITVPDALIEQLQGDTPTSEPGYQAAQRLIASKAAFTALFAFNDVSAIGAIRALREAGLRVPQDVSVVGFDDVQSAAFQNPALTTVRQPLHSMGMLAAETLIQQIASSATQDAVRQVMVDPELIVRESTGPAPAKR